MKLVFILSTSYFKSAKEGHITPKHIEIDLIISVSSREQRYIMGVLCGFLGSGRAMRGVGISHRMGDLGRKVGDGGAKWGFRL